MAYGYKATITIDNTKVSGSSNHSNFPVLVSGTYDGTGSEPDLRSTANGGKIEDGTNGYDLAFYSDSDLTTQLDHEVESHNLTTGEIVMWVRIPTLSYNSDTVFYIAYGDSGISTSQENVTGVWSTGYKGVWHLNGDLNDSTSNANNGTDVSSTDVTGKIANGRGCDAVANKHFYVAYNASLEMDDYTISGWINPSIVSGNQTLFCKDRTEALNKANYAFRCQNADVLFYQTKNGGFETDTSSPANLITAGAWNQLYLRKVGTNYKGFINGSSAASGTNWSAVPDKNQDIVMFGYIYDPSYVEELTGSIDECRIYSGNLSDDYIITDYNTQNSPSTFYTMGTETAAGSSFTPRFAVII